MHSLCHSLQTPWPTQTVMQQAAKMQPMKMAVPPKKQRGEATVGSEEQRDNASEPAESSEDDCDEALPPEITDHDAAGTVADATGKKQVFTKSLAHRDDWLHRGIMLRDMDYYH